MDANMAKALLVYNSQMKPFASIGEARETYCNPMITNWLKTVNNFKPCLKNFQRTVFGIMVVNMKKVAKYTCNSDSELQVRTDDNQSCLFIDTSLFQFDLYFIFSSPLT